MGSLFFGELIKACDVLQNPDELRLEFVADRIPQPALPKGARRRSEAPAELVKLQLAAYTRQALLAATA